MKRKRHTVYAAEILEILTGFSTQFELLWAAWREERRSVHHKPMSEFAEVLQLRDCKAWGEEQAKAAIETSIKRGWQGLFEPREEERIGLHGGTAARRPSPRSASRALIENTDAVEGLFKLLWAAHDNDEEFARLLSVARNKYRAEPRNSLGQSIVDEALEMIEYKRQREPSTAGAPSQLQESP